MHCYLPRYGANLAQRRHGVAGEVSGGTMLCLLSLSSISFCCPNYTKTLDGTWYFSCLEAVIFCNEAFILIA